MFDVTDQSQPKLQSQFEYAGGRQTFSPLVEWAFGLSNNQALGYFSEVGILALPLQHQPDWLAFANDRHSIKVASNLPEMEVLKIDPVKGIEKLGEIQSPTPIDRSMRFGNYLYAMASDRILVVELLKPNVAVAELLLTSPISTGNGSSGNVGSSGSNASGADGNGTGGTKITDEKLIVAARQRFHNLVKPCDVNGDGVIAPLMYSMSSTS